MPNARKSTAKKTAKKTAAKARATNATKRSTAPRPGATPNALAAPSLPPAPIAAGTATPVAATTPAAVASSPHSIDAPTGERVRVGDVVAFRTVHPTGATELVEQIGTVTALASIDHGDGNALPAACVAWVTGGVSGPINADELAKL